MTPKNAILQIHSPADKKCRLALTWSHLCPQAKRALRNCLKDEKEEEVLRQTPQDTGQIVLRINRGWELLRVLCYDSFFCSHCYIIGLLSDAVLPGAKLESAKVVHDKDLGNLEVCLTLVLRDFIIGI